jgi:hypothetical protein
MVRSTEDLPGENTGSVTLDWIVLTAGAVALALGATSMFLGGEGHQASPVPPVVSDAQMTE